MGKKKGGFNHNKYTESLVNSDPAVRACEAIESARRLLQSPKRWSKGYLRTTNAGVIQHCVHGALTRVMGGNGTHYVNASAEDSKRYPDGTLPRLSLQNSRNTNILIALAHSMLEYAKSEERLRPWYDTWKSSATRITHYEALVYSFNDNYLVEHKDLMAAMKRARKACYDFAIKNANKGGI